MHLLAVLIYYYTFNKIWICFIFIFSAFILILFEILKYIYIWKSKISLCKLFKNKFYLISVQVYFISSN